MSSNSLTVAASTLRRRCIQLYADKAKKGLLLLSETRRIVRCKSSAFASPLSDSVRDAVKESLLEEATKADSTFWSSSFSNSVNGVNGDHHHHHHDDAQPQQHQHQQQHPHHHQSSIHEATTYGLEEDPLEEWYWDRKTKYWPNLPPSVTDSDPFALSQQELDTLDQSIRQDLIGTDHPVLSMAASYFFQPHIDGGKKVRPRMVLLMSHALQAHYQQQQQQQTDDVVTIVQRPDLSQAQRRLAEISELIHTASLFHDDVIDESETRRGSPAVHQVFGNKVAILAGDYLLARASIGLARLRQVNVVECMSTIIEHLVRGEVMQMNQTSIQAGPQARLEYYLRKNYFKTGSLMANSCQSAALLGNYPPEWVQCAYRYGKHLGLAFQLVDDVLDYEGNLQTMGKPALNDLKAGLATAPVLFAAQQHPHQLDPLLERKFKHDGDVETALHHVLSSKGIEKTTELARVHAELAMEAVLELQPSVYRDALVQLAYKVVDRTR